MTDHLYPELEGDFEEYYEDAGLTGLSPADVECRECGCTPASACETAAGHCFWIEPDLCSACALGAGDGDDG